MDKVASPDINAFRSALDLAGSVLDLDRTPEEQLREIIDELERRIQDQDEQLISKDLQLEELLKQPIKPEPFIIPTPQPSADLEKVRVQLNDALAERDELKEKYRDALRKAHAPDSEFKKEADRLRAEVRTLKETQQARIRAEREAERDKVKTELQGQKDGWQRMFTCLERLAIKSVATLSEHEADSQEIRDLARELRNKPGELRSRLAMDELTYQDAFGELAPLIYGATGEISRFKKRSVAVTKVEHRARLLLDSLKDNNSTTVTRATDIIFGDEGYKPKKMTVLRAMQKAAALEPHRVSFFKGTHDGMPSRLVRNGGLP